MRSVADIGDRPWTFPYSEVPSASGTVADDEAEEREAEEGEAEEREAKEVEGEEGWLRGVAHLPRLPATEEKKTLIGPKGKDNWQVIGTGRIPNGVVTILLRDFWPGLYNPRPNEDPQCEERVLAMRWHQYEAAPLVGYGTHAQAVITHFWEFYRVPKEEKARADKVLVAAAIKMLRHILYEVRWVAITHYYHTGLHKKMTRERVRKEPPPYDQGAVFGRDSFLVLWKE